MLLQFLPVLLKKAYFCNSSYHSEYLHLEHFNIIFEYVAIVILNIILMEGNMSPFSYYSHLVSFQNFWFSVITLYTEVFLALFPTRLENIDNC